MSDNSSAMTESAVCSVATGNGVPMFVKIIGGIILLGVVLVSVKWFLTKNPDPALSTTVSMSQTATMATSAPQTVLPMPVPQTLLPVPVPETVAASVLPKTVAQPVTGGVALAVVPSVTQKVPMAIGCFADTYYRAMSDTPLGSNALQYYTTFEKCKQTAIDNGSKYFALQDGIDRDKDGSLVGVCFTSNDLSATQKYGTATNCKLIPGTANYTGAAWSNYVYGL